MNRRLATVLFFAFLVAAGCSYFVYRVMVRQIATVPKPPTTSVILAARDLQIGAVVRDADLVNGEWVGPLPKGAITSKDQAAGRGVISMLYQGEPILDSRLAAEGSGGGLAATIRPGMRACAVKVNEVVGVAGFVTPGMRVDVLISGGEGAGQGPKVKTLLQNIEVLSAGTNIQKDAEGKPVQVPVVNLLVTPEQAELLSLASNETKIQLVLRNPLDTETPKTPGIAMASLFSEGEAPKPKPVAVRKPAPPQAVQPTTRIYLVEVLNGGKHSQEKFERAEDPK